MHYVIGDIHGQIHALKILLGKLNLQPDDKVYFVGDWFDRAYTEKDTAETVRWMLENLTEGSQFCSVVGNHDLGQLERINYSMQNTIEQENSIEWQVYNLLPESEESKYIRSCYPRLKALIESMPLYETFFAAGQEFLVTHSWLVDNSESGIGEKDFDLNNLNQRMSIWDRRYSVMELEHPETMPVVVHGHTPTLISYNNYEDGCRALARIKKVTEKNINVDCCAFYSPLRGGNLAAYRCEDGAEFYAYEEEQFYELVDEFIEKKPLGEANITREQWYFAVLFRNQYLCILSPKASEIPHFENEKVKWAYEKMREKFAECSEEDLLFEAEDYMRRIKERLRVIVPKYWPLCREQL